MDRYGYNHVPGTLLGHLRHRAEGRIRRWRKLPPEAGAVAVADTGVNSDADADTQCDTEPDSNTGADAIGNPDPGAEPDSNSGAVAKCNAVGNSDTKCDAGTVADAQRVSNGHADTESVAQRNSDSVAEGHALGDGAGRLPTPHAGSGGCDTSPAAAQAAGWGTTGPHRRRRRADRYRGISPDSIGSHGPRGQLQSLLAQGVTYHRGMLVITTGIPR